MLNSRQRAQLRGMANDTESILQIGKMGISENTVKQAEDVLEARELVKISVLETSPLSSREAADELALKVKADVVQVIGRKFILYRQSRENKTIKLVK